jgi:hypothetical protein
MVWRSVLMVPVVLAACGGGGDDGGGGGDVTPFIGLYSTTSHTRAMKEFGTVSCADEGSPIEPFVPFFQLAVDKFEGDPGFLRLSHCLDAAARNCVGSFVALRAGGPGLEEQSASSQTGGGVTCELHFARSEATLDGATIAITLVDKVDVPNIPSSACTLQRAEALASSTECRVVTRLTGTRLE